MKLFLARQCSLWRSRLYGGQRLYKRLALTAATLLLGLGLLPQQVKAVLGFGDIVFDPTAVAQLVLEYERQGLQYAEELATSSNTLQTVVNTYETVQNTLHHYELALAQAKFFTSKAYWKSFATILHRDAANNVLGETKIWNVAINGDSLNAPAGWSNATVNLSVDTSWLAGQPVGASAPVSDLASVEIADSMGINTLRTLADFRNMQTINDEALKQLEEDALDTSDQTNVQVKQLNLTAASTVQIVRSQENMMNVLGYQLEQQMLASKPLRDGMASALNRNAASYAYQHSEATEFQSPLDAIQSYVAP